MKKKRTIIAAIICITVYLLSSLSQKTTIKIFAKEKNKKINKRQKRKSRKNNYEELPF